MKEEWKDIEGYEGLYQVSNLGRIKSLKFNKERIIKVYIRKNYYPRVELFKENKSKKFFLHRLVANAFIPNIDNKPQVNHKNGVKTDNSIENLEWVTNSENMKHAYQNGLRNVKKRKVIQLSITNDLLKKWDSVKEASESLKINQNHIRECCNSKAKTAGGYIWKYLI